MSKKQFVVLGLGRFGMSVAKSLSENGYDVLAVDNDSENVQEAAEFVTHAVKADVSDELSLRLLGISNFDVLINAIGEDLEASVMGTLLAKELGISYVVAKAKTDIQKRILEKIGVDKIVFPEREMGERLANNLMYGNFVELMELSEEFGIGEFDIRTSWVGLSLAQADIRNQYKLNVIAIKNNSGKFDASPAPDKMFEKGDIIVALGENNDIQRFLKKGIGKIDD